MNDSDTDPVENHRGKRVMNDGAPKRAVALREMRPRVGSRFRQIVNNHASGPWQVESLHIRGAVVVLVMGTFWGAHRHLVEWNQLVEPVFV